MVFMFVHFGKHRRAGWCYASAVYGGLCEGERWSWERVHGDPKGFRAWLDAVGGRIRAEGGGFGNHRKYESLNGLSERGTGAAVESYVQWVGAEGHHDDKIAEVIGTTQTSPAVRFSQLYASLEVVARFGRTARFDYLTTISRLGFTDIVPDKAYLVGFYGSPPGCTPPPRCDVGPGCGSGPIRAGDSSSSALPGSWVRHY